MKISERFRFHLLLLQLEEYDVFRFLNAVKKTNGTPPKHPIRKPLVWTSKIKLTAVLAKILLLSLYFLAYQSDFASAFKIASAVILTFAYYRWGYIFITAATIILLPFDLLVKEAAIMLAKSKIKKFPDLKIIGVAGSYGKTGMKEFIATVLSQKYNVVKTEASVNTPYAISQLILKKLDRDTEILIVEMGEYYRGDIKNLCMITPPDIAVVTGINEAHLERLKKLDTAIETIFEIVRYMEPKGLVILNGQDKNISVNQKKYTAGHEVYLYRDRNRGEFDDTIPGYIVKVEGKKIFFPLLGEYNLDKIDAVIFLGQKLGMTVDQIVDGIKNISPVPHRLQPLPNKSNNTLIIDDSYNGNPDGVSQAIDTLSKFTRRRKIYITPGLVEMGEKKSEIHYNIGSELAGVADMVILIKNSVTPDIERGLLDRGFDSKKIVWFQSADEAYRSIKEIMEPGDVVLLQNDWPDNYQ